MTRATMEVKAGRDRASDGESACQGSRHFASSGQANRRVSPAPIAEELALSRFAGNGSGAKNYSAGASRRVCAGRQSLVSFNRADERTAGESRRG